MISLKKILTKVLLENIVAEVGESTEGYPLYLRQKVGVRSEEGLKNYRDAAIYEFLDDDNNKYVIELKLSLYDRLEVDFHIETKIKKSEGGFHTSYGLTNRGDQFKILATVANAIEKELEADKEGVIKGIEYSPTYRDKDNYNIYKKRAAGQDVGGDIPRNARDMLYRAFIAKRIGKRFPNATIDSGPGDTVVNFNRDKTEELNEVGESSEGYPVTLDYESPGPKSILFTDGYEEYTFRDSNDDEFGVEIYNKRGYLDVSFSSIENGWAATNKGEQFKIMGTVVNIVDKILKQGEEWSEETGEPNPIKGVKYKPADALKDVIRRDTDTYTPGESGAVNRRDKLYRAYIRNRYPEAQVSQDRNGEIWVNFKGEDVTKDIPSDVRPVDSNKI